MWRESTPLTPRVSSRAPSRISIIMVMKLGMPKSSEVPPEEYLLEENEERSMIEPKSYDNPRLKDLISILIEWVNDELHGR